MKRSSWGTRPSDTASRARLPARGPHTSSVRPGAEADGDQQEGGVAALRLGNEALGDPLNQATGSFRNPPSRSSKLSLIVHLPVWRPGQRVDIL